MKKVLVGAMALLTLAACSNEEVLQKNEVKQEIGFTAVTGKATSRAKDGYCNTSLPEEFKVWASAQNKNYFENEAYKKYEDDGPWKPSDGTVRYWPESGTVDFYATKNENGTPTWKYTTPTSLKFEGYTVNDNVTAQTDFIYAASLNTAKGSGTATLNFRHALSQIEFKAKNENSKIYIEIDEVKLVNVYNKGDITISKDTDPNFVDHGLGDDADTDTDTRDNVCDWASLGGNATYSVSLSPAVTFDETKTESLTVTDPTGKEFNANTMYILPQEHAVWDKSTAAQSQTGSYFIVKALIYNKAGDNVNKDNDVVVWGYKTSDDSWETKEIAIPVPTATVWKDGKRYVYTFVFTTTGTGGYDPVTNDPVLTPIKLSVTVDDFVDAGKTDVTM